MWLELPKHFPVLLDPEKDPDSWSLETHPFQHLSVGEHVLEELRGHAHLGWKELTDILGQQVWAEAPKKEFTEALFKAAGYYRKAASVAVPIPIKGRDNNGHYIGLDRGKKHG